jgi:ubiquinone/menaquinone biosynthesis C-methylase UbiE
MLLRLTKKAFWYITGGSKKVAVNQFDGIENSINFPAKSTEVQQRIINALKLSSEDRFLDAGCAHGDLLLQVFSKVKSAIGIDLAEKNLLVAKQRLQGTNVELKKADFKSISLNNGEVTAICCNASFMYVPLNERLMVLMEFYRLLATGGRLFLGDLIFDSEDRGWGIYMWKVKVDEIRELAKQS